MPDAALDGIAAQIEALRAQSERLRAQPLARPAALGPLSDGNAPAAAAAPAAVDSFAAAEAVLASIRPPQRTEEWEAAPDADAAPEIAPSARSRVEMAAERSARYDALVHGVVRRAWDGALRDYRAGRLLGGGGDAPAFPYSSPTRGGAGGAPPHSAGAASPGRAVRAADGDLHPHRPASNKRPSTTYSEQARLRANQEARRRLSAR
jgi:hypothetical protein